MPRIFRAPGRINLIGEYTDINDGYVLPAAISFATYVAAAPRNERQIRAASLNFEGELLFDLDQPETPVAKSWTRYIQGVGVVIESAGFTLQGADLLVDSDIPIGAGLSSSAALGVASAFALSTLSGHEIEGFELVKIAQSAEHKYAGVRSGIMDQFASVFGKANHSLFLDCRSLEWLKIPVPQANFIICDTKIKHALAESEYNNRRAQCEVAAEFFTPYVERLQRGETCTYERMTGPPDGEQRWHVVQLAPIMVALDDGKARFNVAPYTPPAEDVDEEYPIILTTGRVVSQFLSGTQTRRIGPRVDQYPNPLIELHPQLAEKLGSVKK